MTTETPPLEDRVILAAGRLGVMLRWRDHCSPIHLAILAFIERSPRTVGEIRDRFGENTLSGAAATHWLDSMEARHLADRVSNPQDRRTFLIQITENGRGFLNRYRATVKEELEA